MSDHQTEHARATILIVDDTPANLRLLAGLLTSRGYVVRPARNGEMALLCAQTLLPDLILLDIMMPGMDGYEVCKQLKTNQQTSDIPVIFLSALNEVANKVKAFSVGGVDYITKPFQMAEVLARVETHLAMQNLQKQLKEKNKALESTLLELQATEQKLIQKNEALQYALQNLKTTQNQLIESEKMAALGGLVAGVAHEINTPIGLGVTAASTLANATKSFVESYKTGKLRRSVLHEYLETTSKGSQLLLDNLQRAAELVQSFKQVAVDQTSFSKREFALKAYIKKTLLSLDLLLKQTKHQVQIHGNDTITLLSYPGAFSQVVTNLVMNSIKHAYPDKRLGVLCFKITQIENQVQIEYSDDGCGIAPENLAKIFDPFFTTARNQGGTGLGLHLVYNLVIQKLGGTIRCESKLGLGTTFILTLPIQLSNKE
ncbi:MAG: hybrid sensor histidine kinase/response regulator [Ardenticatenaceae bacterium]